MKVTFIGDVMLGRFVASKYKMENFHVLSSEVRAVLESTDFVIANLESPVSDEIQNGADHLAFKGEPELLDQFAFVNCFSLSNNHINDFGKQGMDDSINQIDKRGISWNGLFKDVYKPYIFEKDGIKCALITCTDMMNIPFDENVDWKTLKIDDKLLDEIIVDYKNQGFIVLLYAHVGMLFTRFPNPPIRSLLHDKIDLGADAIITVHSHVLGGMEYYKGKPIFHSIGDFVMDGNSYRRRQAAILELNLQKQGTLSWDIIPTVINSQFVTQLAESKVRKRMLKSWNYVSKSLNKHQSDYEKFFSKKYKIEILIHIISTLKYLLATKGIKGAFRLIIKRLEEVKRMKNWMKSNRSKKRYDDDVIAQDRIRYSQKELFGID